LFISVSPFSPVSGSNYSDVFISHSKSYGYYAFFIISNWDLSTAALASQYYPIFSGGGQGGGDFNDDHTAFSAAL
jgi:hypothetical protein